jgi:hypothetical protein
VEREALRRGAEPADEGVEHGGVDARREGEPAHPRGAPTRQPVDLRRRRRTRLVERRLEASVEVGDDPAGLGVGDVAAGDERVGVEPAHRGVLVDLFVHERLGVARVVALVVAVAPVADEVDDDVLVEGLAVGEGDAGDAHARLGVVPVHVEDR